MSRGFLLSFTVLGLALTVLFAAYPSIDLQVAEWFFDPRSAKFPLSADYEWNLVRRVGNWVPFLLLAHVGFVLLRKLVFPSERMMIAPSVAFYLVASFLLGPGITSNLLLKETWGRPRPNGVQQFAGLADFQPWWRPSTACKRNCSFVSGEASAAFWTVAPAGLAPTQMRPVALGAAVIFGAAVGSLRIAFGRHFVSDVVFGGLITIGIVIALFQFLLKPLQRKDVLLERGIERASFRLHRFIAVLLGAAGQSLANAGSSLGSLSQRLHQRVACL